MKHTVLGSSRYTTAGLPMRLMATLSLRFIPPLYVRTCLSPTPPLNRFTLRSAAFTASCSCRPYTHAKLSCKQATPGAQDKRHSGYTFQPAACSLKVNTMVWCTRCVRAVYQVKGLYATIAQTRKQEVHKEREGRGTSTQSKKSRKEALLWVTLLHRLAYFKQ